MAQDPGLLKLLNSIVDAKYDPETLPDSSVPLPLESKMISMAQKAASSLLAVKRREL
jgi:hypothetical protein